MSSYIPNLYGFIDSNNSSTTALTSNSVYTGTSVESTDYSSLTVSITTDQSSATNGLSIQFSSDGTNWDIIRGDTITVGNPGTAFNTTFRYNIEARYYRIIYTNGTTGQSIFRLQSLLNAQSANSVGIYSSTIGTSRYKREINCTNSGALNVNLAEPTSTYGDVRMGCLTPLTQFDFVYGLNTNYITTTTATGGTVTASNQLAVATTTTTSGSSAIFQSKKYFKCRDGLGALARFSTIFSTGITNNNQIAGCGDTTDGYFFGYNGTSFGILYRRNASDTWTTQTNWNIDNMSGNGGVTNPSGMKLDPTKGNIYQIGLGYLGFANISFFIYNPTTYSFIRVHTLRYANTATVPIVTNPSLNLYWQNINTGTAASTKTLSSASGSLFIDGTVLNTGSKYGRSISKTNPGTTQINMITVRNNTTINSITNKAPLRITKLTISATDSSLANNSNTLISNLYLNATVGGTPAFTNVDATNSVAAFDTAGTTITGGTIVQSYSCCYSTSQVINFDTYDIILYPSDLLTITCLLTASTATTRVVVSVDWVEDT